MNNAKIVTLGKNENRDNVSRFASMEDLIDYKDSDFELLLDFEAATPVCNANIWALVDDECRKHKISADEVFVYLTLKSEGGTFIAVDHPTRDEPYYIPFELRKEEIMQAINTHAHDYIMGLIQAFDLGEYLVSRGKE